MYARWGVESPRSVLAALRQARATYRELRTDLGLGRQHRSPSGGFSGYLRRAASTGSLLRSATSVGKKACAVIVLVAAILALWAISGVGFANNGAARLAVSIKTPPQQRRAHFCHLRRSPAGPSPRHTRTDNAPARAQDPALPQLSRLRRTRLHRSAPAPRSSPAQTASSIGSPSPSASTARSTGRSRSRGTRRCSAAPPSRSSRPPASGTGRGQSRLRWTQRPTFWRGCRPRCGRLRTRRCRCTPPDAVSPPHENQLTNLKPLPRPLQFRMCSAAPSARPGFSRHAPSSPTARS